ncbi:MAG TPA: hypothetical protein VLN73_04915, partial [Alphaproteobacteria bacterium]|nr:hypothetical protein [Alphaproteobacteria bacterium]
PGLKVTVSEPAALDPLREALSASAGGRGEVSLILGLAPGKEVEVEVPGRYAVSPAVLMDLKSLPGIAEVREI